MVTVVVIQVVVLLQVLVRAALVRDVMERERVSTKSRMLEQMMCIVLHVARSLLVMPIIGQCVEYAMVKVMLNDRYIFCFLMFVNPIKN